MKLWLSGRSAVPPRWAAAPGRDIVSSRWVSQSVSQGPVSHNPLLVSHPLTCNDFFVLLFCLAPLGLDGVNRVNPSFLLPYIPAQSAYMSLSSLLSPSFILGTQAKMKKKMLPLDSGKSQLIGLCLCCLKEINMLILHCQRETGTVCVFV